MTFDLVLKSFLANEGKRFRRDWDDEECFVFMGEGPDGPMRRIEEGEYEFTWAPTPDDLFADDWEEVRD